MSEAERAFLATAATPSDTTDILKHQLATSPLIAYSALVTHHPKEFPSRGLLGSIVSASADVGDVVYSNIHAPSSTVVCGVQGSGKSHTVSCMLESALIQDPRIGELPNPLSALLFHLDTQDNGRPCEAAHISSQGCHDIDPTTLPKVIVFCSPSNATQRKKAYAGMPHVWVEPLYLPEAALTVNVMLAIMGCEQLGAMPLYMHTVLNIIRAIGVDHFTYREFKRRLDREQLDGKQKAMIKLRLDLLDGLVRPKSVPLDSHFIPGGLVIVDLTDPFVDASTAAVLFDAVLASFTRWNTNCGKVVVLDEAHKYLKSSDSERLKESICNIIRLQRHLGMRVIIATQEPTVVPATILDLASVIICHRFSSPAWCAHLAKHVSDPKADWYDEVMLLATGDAIVFSPAALVDASGYNLLGRHHLTIRVRPRLTQDGGMSALAAK
ncbi:p-loop containing nucleoside triphosphate hydrolase protein [Mycena kentingensis (nom. inval.)]|nr:p-loop containing nucleoside triphosphate hydrolase protein [Mycena kentingensis (nom. inval.)]